MDTLPSTEFRKKFARLTKGTTVTVNGHVIGAWLPVPTDGTAKFNVSISEIPTTDPDPKVFKLHEPWRSKIYASLVDEPTLNTRPFTPVPKKGK